MGFLPNRVIVLNNEKDDTGGNQGCFCQIKRSAEARRFFFLFLIMQQL
jgi:hypothetical protein